MGIISGFNDVFSFFINFGRLTLSDELLWGLIPIVIYFSSEGVFWVYSSLDDSNIYCTTSLILSLYNGVFISFFYGLL